MADSGNQIGLEAIWADAGFQKGVTDYIQKVNEANKATSESANVSKTEAQPAAAGLSGVMGMLATATGLTVPQLALLTSALGAGIAIFKSVADAVGGLIQQLVDLGPQAIETASRVQQLNYIAQILGQRQGYSGEQVDQFIQKINKQGIALGVAGNAVAQFARFSLDMSDAVKLAAVAQDAGTLANESSSDAMDGLIHGIITMNTRILRTHGILVDVSQVQDDYAASLGKTTDQLSNEEKVQAVLNGVIAEGARIQGAYAISMTTGGKVMGSISGRLIPDMLAALGMPFQTAFFNVADSIANVIKGFTAMISEGGALYPLLVDLGAVASILTGGIHNASVAFLDFATNGLAPFISMIETNISNAFTWGFNLVTNFAMGMIQAGADALTAAMNWISGMLSGWMAPGSPPKIAPNIIKWGIATVGMWLQGFTEADFSVLEGIQNPLKDALTVLSDLGKISQESVGTTFANLSKQVISDMENLGGISEKTYAKLRKSGGVYGKELEDLARTESDLAKATKESEQAQKDLTTAQERASSSGAKINTLTAEYNAMLRGGASKEELAAKLAQINLAKQEKKNADVAVTDAEKKVETTKDEVDTLKEKESLQGKILKQMLDLSKAQIESARAAEAAAAAAAAKTPTGGGGGVPKAPKAPVPASDLRSLLGNYQTIFDPIKKAVEDAKARILAQLGEIWNNLKAKWDSTAGAALARLSASWETLKANAKAAWDMMVQNTSTSWESLKQAVVDKYNATEAWLENAFATTKAKIESWWVLMKVNTALEWEGIKQAVVDKYNATEAWLENAFATTKANIESWWVLMKVNTALEWEELKTNVTTKFGEAKTWVETQIAIFETNLSTTWDNIKKKVSDTWDAIKTAASTKVDEIVSYVTDTIHGIVTTIGTYVNEFYNAGKELILGMKQGILDFMGEMIQSVINAIEEAIRKAKELLGIPHSPSGVFMDIGKDTMLGFSEGIQDWMKAPIAATAVAATSTAAAARVPIVGGSTTKTMNLNMSPTINSGMDLAFMKSFIIKTVREGMS